MGEIAQPGMPILTVVAPGSVYLEATAPARYAGSLRVGQRAQVIVGTMPDRPVEGEISQVLPVAGSDNRSVRVRIRLKTEVTLTPGVGARAAVTLDDDTAGVSVTVDALRTEGDTTYVFVVENGRAQRRNVTVGAAEGSYAQVLSGLNSGEMVIVSGPSSLQQGTPVTVVTR
jgi:membrane fusion protein, multidrug efflux system